MGLKSFLKRIFLTRKPISEGAEEAITEPDLESWLESLPGYSDSCRMNNAVCYAWKYTQYKDRDVPAFNVSPCEDGRVMARWSANSCSSWFWFFEGDGKAYYEIDEDDPQYVKDGDNQSYKYDVNDVVELTDAALMALYQALDIDLDKVASQIMSDASD